VNEHISAHDLLEENYQKLQESVEKLKTVTDEFRSRYNIVLNEWEKKGES